ncbi:recombinase family protein [Metabacillus bambusae]|uniref:Recombinase family protein n=1 Tax=Metabacillus bambusae TaxID=2795218 RepID=A0ABS3N5Y9_9BACI|nr:recombinase family protein [Metabacillus bambusae]MBO1513706.1 recombinase family protein [Metabacillus bambusae]
MLQTQTEIGTAAATETKHVALMLRISRDKGENEDTLQNHRETLSEYAANHGLTYDIYAEIISGGITEIEERPELQSMITNIEKYEAILCISLDRLARNGVVSQQIKQLCIDYNIEIITPAQTFDLSNNQQDRLLYDISSTFAVLEYETIAKRNKLNKISRSKRGEHVAGSVPFGYSRNKETKRLEIVEEEAVVIRYIFKLHASGLGAYKIRDILNEEGYRSAKGKAFSLPSVRRILKNPAYRGAVVFNDRKKVKEDGKYVYKVIETYIAEDAHEPIISPSDWYKANDIRQARAEHAATHVRERPSKNAHSMLKDLLICGCCGRKSLMLKDSKSAEVYVKVCDYLLPNSTQKCGNAGMQLRYVIEEFADFLERFKGETKKKLAQITSNDTSSIANDLVTKVAHIDKQTVETQRQYDNLINLAVEGIFSKKEILAKKQELTERLIFLQQTREETQTKLVELDVKSEKDRLREIIDILENFDGEDVITQNEHLKTFIKAIRYTRKMPSEIKALSTRNPARRNYPFKLEIEYI